MRTYPTLIWLSMISYDLIVFSMTMYSYCTEYFVAWRHLPFFLNSEISISPSQRVCLSTCLFACLSFYVAGWLADWLASKLAGELAGWLASYLPGLLTSWLASYLPGWLADSLASLLAGWVAGCMSFCLRVYLFSFPLYRIRLERLICSISN